MFHKQLGKMTLAVISAGGGDFFHRLAGGEQQFLGPVHPQLGDVLVVGDAQLLLEQIADVIGGKSELFRQAGDGKVFAVMFVDVADDGLGLSLIHI